MKKYSLVFGIALVALIAIFVYRHSHKNTPFPGKYSAAEHATPRGHTESKRADLISYAPPLLAGQQIRKEIKRILENSDVSLKR